MSWECEGCGKKEPRSEKTGKPITSCGKSCTAKKYYRKNKKKILKKVVDRYYSDIEKSRKMNRKYAIVWRSKHKEEHKQYMKRRYKENPKHREMHINNSRRGREKIFEEREAMSEKQYILCTTKDNTLIICNNQLRTLPEPSKRIYTILKRLGIINDNYKKYNEEKWIKYKLK